MSEVFFYHLLHRSLEQALPEMLEKTLARGWRAVVRAGQRERLEALNAHLWTYSRDGFLPHGMAGDGDPARQPIWLTDAVENPNGAEVLFLLDGADGADQDAYRRVCDLFNGKDDDAVAAARRRWATAKAAGHALTYWQQTEQGWSRQADG